MPFSREDFAQLPGWLRHTLLLFGKLVVAGLLVAPGLILIGRAGPRPVLTALLSTLWSGLAFLAAFYLVGRNPALLRQRPADRYYGWAVGLAVLVAPVGSFLLPRVEGISDPRLRAARQLAEDATDPTGALLMLLFVVANFTLTPLAEEFFFRGLLFDALLPFGRATAVIVSSLVFGALHGSLYLLPYFAIIGGGLAMLRLTSGSLRPPVLAHALLNLLVTVLGIAGGPG